MLDALTPELCSKASGFLKASLTQRTSVVDFFSFLYAAMLAELGGGPGVFADSPPGWDARVADMLETFRTPDGGYAKTVGSKAGSTYHTFLVSLCYQLLTWPIPQQAEMVQFVLSRRREDGGFVEIGPMKRSGTNPTAAAVGVLQIVESAAQPGAVFTPDVREGVVDFLAAMPSEEDGFRANARAPLADLLSTFTGLWTLRQLGASTGWMRPQHASMLKDWSCPPAVFTAASGMSIPTSSTPFTGWAAWRSWPGLRLNERIHR